MVQFFTDAKLKITAYNCIIGMGAILLDNVSIGSNSIIGAGTLVTKDKKIPEKSLVLGAPGKVVRNLTVEETLSIKKNAEDYVLLSAKYK